MKVPEQTHQSHQLHQQKQKEQTNQTSPRARRTSSFHESPWKQIKSSSQQIHGRYHHTSILHENKLYVYGGFENDVGILADFKVFNCEDEKEGWKTLSVEGGPGPRHSHSAVLHEGVIYIFGGKFDRFKSTNSLHCYNISTDSWKQAEPHFEVAKPQKTNKKTIKIENKPTQPLNSNKPAPIDSHQAVIVNDQMIIYGGFTDNQFSNNIYAYKIETQEWRKIYPHQSPSQSQPEPRSDFSMVAYNQKLYIYAGKNMHRNFGDLWEFDLASAQFKKIDILADLQNRSGHTAVVYQNSMIVFGGITSVTHERDDLLFYSFETNSWNTLWTNCEDRENKKRIAQKKLSNTKVKSLEANLCKGSHDQGLNEKPRKYRRPLAEEKLALNFKKQDFGEKQRHKKQNERKYLLINELECLSTQNEHLSPQQYSPLIESLSNSIMLTSNAYHTSPNSSAREAQKQSNFFQTQTDMKQKRVKARDGHTAHIFGDQMLVFGGDRHMFAINDILYINIEDLMLNAKTKKSAQEGKIQFEEQPKIGMIEI